MEGPTVRVLAYMLMCVALSFRAAADPARWSDERLAARLVGAAFRESEITTEAKTWVRDRGLGAIVLYGTNLEQGSGVAALTRALLAAVPAGDAPPILAVDQEGGSVIRHEPIMLPSAMAIAATRSETIARQAGRRVGCGLREAGVTMNLAPVVDLAAGADTSGLGTRAFSSDPALVASLATAYLEGLHEGGVLATAKHFPGQGYADVDPHDRASSVDRAPEVMKREDLVPFRAAIAANVDAIMPAHVAYPRWPGAGGEPATFSAALIRSLRNDLHFERLIITDAINMAGTGEADPGRAAVRAIEAGADLVITNGTRHAHLAVNGIVAAIRNGTLPRERVLASVRRVLLARPPAPRPGACEAIDGALADRLARAAITELRFGAGSAAVGESIFAGPAGPLAEAFSPDRRVALPIRPAGSHIESLAREIARSKRPVVAGVQNRMQARVIRRARELRPELKLTLVILGAPADVAGIAADRYLFAYGFRAPEQRAVLDVLQGKRCAPGRLPVDVGSIAKFGAGDAGCVSSEARESR